MVTRIIWSTSGDRRMEHSMGFRCTYAYARDWFRRNIEECQGIMGRDERRESQLRLIGIQNTN